MSAGHAANLWENFEDSYVEPVREEMWRSAFNFWRGHLSARVFQRCLAGTKEGLLGMVPPSTVPGDLVACIKGVSYPMIVRPRNNCRFQLIGRAYFHGFMGWDERRRQME